ncbi:hypothetical protein IG193_05510 [Infirmifilum lucidum]|uniref:Uncharacterized protein n=1 Tax=Infirmifilum lucidum TaxID=2776706 RepID=A0A7L9FF27_9CREN|nr:hypothetical protein [Infirmifilum lucidum]QOJ78231.1 hypothetical protein IG193_05510 [Infirmifilum lucidum]
MVKKAVFEVVGCTRAELEDTLKSSIGFSSVIPVETRSGLLRVQVKIKSMSRISNCWELKTGLSSGSKWMWGEVFDICIYDDETALRMVVTRKKGVGRINADVLGMWILELVRSKNSNLTVRIVERF